ncbi:MFS general substrate transporter [Lentithecium fluviatile CBS 122367]|uniref:MFS general substrate transporter n=1 Tax=Lentithecium fluviatile CBS 122367 TaxID=1168545 RepID=A0A6G1IVM3_9PLEO|nr:MFS general substrate transporter [Lentithecium fluviatile CBS 122367]
MSPKSSHPVPACQLNTSKQKTNAITSSFHTLEDLPWYGSGYLLTVTAMQPSFGKLYRLLSIKGVYVSCIVVFEVGSILCAAAPTSAVFIAGRAIAGVGAAGLLQGALVIITHTVPLEKRPLYMSIVISVFGTFTGKISWRCNVPIGSVVLFLILVFLKIRSDTVARDSRPKADWRKRIMKLDPIGATLIIPGICCLLLALQWGGQALPWKSSRVIGLCVGSGLLFAAFMIVQWKLGEDAILLFFILKQRSIFSGAFFLFFTAMPMTALRSSPLASGVDFLAFALPQIGPTVVSGGLATAFGYYVPYMIVGTAISIVGSGLIMTLQVATCTAKWAGFLVVCGLGTGMAINQPYTAVQAVVLEHDTPIANAVLQFAFQLGAALSLSISQTLFINKLRLEVQMKTPAIPPDMVISAGASNLPLLVQSPDTLLRLREAYTNSVRHVFIFALAAACCGFTFSFGFEHRNVKKVAAERKAAEESIDTDGDMHQHLSIHTEKIRNAEKVSENR